MGTDIFFVSQRNMSKLERLAKHKRAPAPAIVREGIAA